MIINRFEEQVKKYPNHLAVKTAKKELTYQALNHHANALAREIFDQCNVKDLIDRATVALLFEHGSDMIVGKFGTLKAARIYVPLDPTYPLGLLAYMLKNSEASLVITNDENIGLAKRLIQESNREATIINISKIEAIANLENINPECDGSEVAYILYTSGSTGRPKGVMQSHRNVLHFAECYGNAIKIKPEDRMTLLSSFSHDGGIGDICVALLNGATLYPLDVKSGISMDEIGSWLKAERISIWHSVPTLYRYFVNAINVGDDFPSLRFIAVGGESVLPHDIKLFRKIFPAASFAILYGQSESSISSIQLYHPDSEIEAITLGEPVKGTEIVVIDENREEVSPLNVGEILVISDYVALGYWKDEEKSSEVFKDIPGVGRAYFTGDLGKLLLDGRIEVHGRIDFQVKIRGFRIELSGIENQLLEHDMVKEAIVKAFADDTGEKYLCAYIVSEGEIVANEIREHLSANLQDYMIPSYFVRMEKFPLMPNGKVDRKSLPKPDEKPEAEYAPPRNASEAILSRIWSEVLGKERVGIYDNFFELGGHSLRATDVVSKIHKELGIVLPLRELFKKPTIAEISESLTAAEKNVYVAIEVAKKQEYYEVSSAQKRIWLLQQLDHESTAYNMPAVLILDGNLDQQRLEDVFLNLIERHELLRTTFNMAGDLVIQRVNKAENIKFAVEYTESKEENIEAVIEDFIRPFDLNEAPLLRVALIRINTNRHYLLFDMHHIISDGTSLAILTQDFMTLYAGEKLTALPIQYKDFSEWQREYLKSEKMQAQESYWLEQFLGELPLLNLPLDYGRPSVQSFAGGSVEFKINPELTKKLNNLAAEAGATLYMVLLSAVTILLAKYSGQTDIMVGSPIAGRAHADLEGIIGMFVNTLVMRNYPEKDKTYRSFLNEVKETSLTAYENQDYQFEELVDKLDLRRDLSRNPLFDVMFVLQNMEVKELEAEGLKLTKYQREQISSKFDLSFTAIDIGDEILFDVEYCRDLFEHETIERLSVNLQNLIEKIISDKEILLGDIEILSAAESHKILHEFNATAMTYPRDKTVVALFEEQVKQTPESIAVVFEEEAITYEELNAKANILAYKLRDLGVGANDYVGIMTERSTRMIIGIYGIIKAGAAYVPIDPTYPAERIQYMLKDCGSKVVLTYKTKVETAIPLIDLDETEIWVGKTENPVHVNRVTDLLYCIYTSGTTGKPKGVMIEHGNIVNLVMNFLHPLYEKYDVKKSLFNSAYVFDVSIENIFGALTFGVSIHIAADHVRLDAQKLYEYICEKSIDILECTPSYLKTLATVDFKEIPLKVALVGGEKVGTDIVGLFGNSFALYNIYGPTECSVDSTWYLCSDKDVSESKVPIGRPIPNTKVYILDQKRLCGIGIPGELCIAGDGVARGYLNQRELTKEKFQGNPYGAGRLYRTGDLARWLPDGNIEYLGRIDEQVKVRGFRIELGEIESALRKIEAVIDCAVIVREGKGGEKSINAYLVAAAPLKMPQIRDSLEQLLPVYMIPAYMKQIEAIPLTRNGKLDKQALPEITAKTETEYVLPRTKIEEKLCRVFEEVLDTCQVGVKDNFFELGGDSIKAIRIVSKLREINYTISVKDIMQGRTIERIASSVSVVLDENPYEQEEVIGVVETTPIIKAFNSWNFAVPNHFNQAVMLPIGMATSDEVKRVLTALVVHHDMLRAIYKDQTLEILDSKISKLFDFYEFDLREVENARSVVERKCTEIQGSINLTVGPLVKAALFRVKDGSFIMLCIHHLVVDGVSWRILGEDFETALNQVIREEEVKLPKKTASFKEWSERLNDYGAVLSRSESEYWSLIKAELENGKIEGAFGDDVNASKEKTVIRTNVVFSEEMTKKLQTKAHSAFGTKIDEIILSGLSQALGRLVKQKFVGIMLEGHGREELDSRIEVDRTVGWFTTLYPIILICCEDIRKNVIWAKETMRSVPNGGLGYSYASNDGDLEPDIYFNYLGEFSGNESKVNYGTGEGVAEENGIMGAINFNGFISNGLLIFEIACRAQHFGTDFMEKMAAAFKECVSSVIDFCVEAKVEKTASDYGLSGFSMLEFEKLIKVIKTEPEKIYGLTPLQEGMLFHYLQDTASTNYVIQHSYDISGQFDTETLAEALRLVALRYEVLRTSIVYKGVPEAKQVILKDRVLELRISDLREYSEKERITKYEQVVKEELERGFDLQEDSLMRVTCVRFAEEHYKLLWNSHHIILDGWCGDLIVEKFIEYYEQLVSGVKVEVIERQLVEEKSGSGEYSDHVAWICSKDKSESLKYWQELLDGYEGISEIKPMLPLGANEKQMHRIGKSLTNELSERLFQLAKDHEVTINTLVETACGILLQRYNNTNDVVFGKVVSGRNSGVKGMDGVVGLFANAIPVRVQTDFEETISELLRKQQKQGIESSNHDFCSLADIQSTVRQKSDLIKILFVFENYTSGRKSDHQTGGEVSNIMIKGEGVREQTNYALSISAAIVEEALNINLMYNPNEYQAREVEFILARFEKIFEEMSEVE